MSSFFFLGRNSHTPSILRKIALCLLTLAHVALLLLLLALCVCPFMLLTVFLRSCCTLNWLHSWHSENTHRMSMCVFYVFHRHFELPYASQTLWRLSRFVANVEKRKQGKMPVRLKLNDKQFLFCFSSCLFFIFLKCNSGTKKTAEVTAQKKFGSLCNNKKNVGRAMKANRWLFFHSSKRTPRSAHFNSINARAK